MESTGFLREYVSSQFRNKFASAGDTWPEDAVLFQNNETEQALVYEYAESLAARAFLKMCNLTFQVEMRPNAEYISPTGRIPFVKAAKMLVGDFDQIVEFVSMKGIKLTELLNQAEVFELRAYMDLINDVLLKSEMYICWIYKPVLEQVTKKRFSSVYTWPLNYIITYQRQIEMQRRLKALGWAHKSIDEVKALIDECCKSLSTKLGLKTYFMMDAGCTELDALVFGHLFTLLTTELDDLNIASIIKRYDNLVSFCQRIEKEYFASDDRKLFH